MTSKPGKSIFFTCLALGASSSLLFSQQLNFQSSFFSPAATRLTTPGSATDIVETEHLPYINQVAKEKSSTAISYSPNASDLLIQQAEQKFRGGRKFYQERDYVNARTAFDA